MNVTAKIAIDYKEMVLCDIRENIGLWEKIRNAKFIQKRTNNEIAKEFLLTSYVWELDTLAQVIADYFNILPEKEQQQYRQVVAWNSSRKNSYKQYELSKRSVEARGQYLYNDEEKLFILTQRSTIEWDVPLQRRDDLADKLNKFMYNENNKIIRIWKNMRTWYTKNRDKK